MLDFFNLPNLPQIILGVASVAGLALVLILWLVFGRGPRRRRMYHASQRLLMQGAWQEALAIIRRLSYWRHSAAWQKRLRTAEASCLRAAMQAALQDRKFEDALEHGLRAAELLEENPDKTRGEIIEAMLAETRRLFAVTTPGSSTSAIHDLLSRTLLVQDRCREALFWQALVHIRDGKLDRGLATLEAARTGEGISWTFDAFTAPTRETNAQPAKKPTGNIDPPLYIGAMLLRQGKPKEALRYLTEANRIDPGGPFVATQLGAAMIATEGDAQVAVRALQRALGPRGFAQWQKQPHQAWIDGLPEGRSYIRRLALDLPYICPLWGADLRLLLHQSHVALGQGHHRLGQYQEAAQVFARLLQESAPSFSVLRGLGLAQAKLGQYDEAFKHLRTAHEMVNETDRIVAGNLALCGARGKPKQDEDKFRNLAWAIRIVGKFTAPKDAEWAALISAIFAEARASGFDISADDQIYLCEHLLSVRAVDPQAADAYHHLQATHPERMHREYAWLYCRAAQEHALSQPHELALFAVTFAGEQAARDFYEQQQWSLRDVEFAWLERAAAREPGHFPTVLGPEYAARGEQLLLEKSAELEQAGQADAALAVAEIHAKLAPHSSAVLDRLAQLHYQRGNIDRAIDLLHSWHTNSPRDPTPLTRLAVLHQQRGPHDDCIRSIHRALEVTDGRQHGDIAFLGARLMIREAMGQDGATEALKASADLLSECLRYRPDHPDAPWLLAAIHWLRQEKAELAQQASSLHRPEIEDPRFHLLAAISHFTAESYTQALDACQRAIQCSEHMGDPLAVEATFVAGWVHLRQGSEPAALSAFKDVASSESSPSRNHAQALLGLIAFNRQEFEAALEHWKSLPSEKRQQWNLGQPLAGSVFLSALQTFNEGRYPEAADRIREAGKLGWRDRRLGQLLTLALARAGQKLLYT